MVPQQYAKRHLRGSPPQSHTCLPRAIITGAWTGYQNAKGPMPFRAHAPVDTTAKSSTHAFGVGAAIRSSFLHVVIYLCGRHFPQCRPTHAGGSPVSLLNIVFLEVDLLLPAELLSTDGAHIVIDDDGAASAARPAGRLCVLATYLFAGPVHPYSPPPAGSRQVSRCCERWVGLHTQHAPDRLPLRRCPCFLLLTHPRDGAAAVVEPMRHALV